MSQKITVLLVDDHVVVRRGFRHLLEDDAALAVVGEAGTADEAVRLAGELQPRVIVMDCAMPGGSGVSACRTIVERHPQAAILVLSMHSEETLVRRALEAGARGYILKDALDLDLAAAVHRIAAGERVLDPKLSVQPVLKGERTHGLTSRELEILQLICQGRSNRDIAARLEVSVNTVAVHRANIMNRLGVHKTAELVVYSIQHGLVDML